MRDLAGFRAAVREHRRAAGRTQQQLARAIGMHPSVLSHKLNGKDDALLTTPDVVRIVTTLADWGALATRTDAEALLESMALPPGTIPAAAWSAPPLAALRAESATGLRRPPPGPAAPGAAGREPMPEPYRREPMPPMEPTPVAAEPLRLGPAPLPAPTVPLVGRGHERAEVAAALATSRLVTLTGVGGTGKTRLALHVAGELAGGFADGVAFVDLAPVSNPALLATAIATALGLAPPAASAAEGHLTGALRDKNLLLVLDNLEQLAEGTPLLTRLLTAAPGLRILATSRIPLHLYGEHTFRVPPLRLPEDDSAASLQDSEAVQLFLARARAAHWDFAPDDDELAAVGAICAQVDGLPLAIELAAARVRLYSPQVLLPLLNSRLALLTGGPRDRPHRQQTLRAALDWSYQLLAARTQRTFVWLGVFTGPFDAAAAAAVSGEDDTPAALDHLIELADQSMLEIMPAATPRFHLLQIVREYALARLARAGQEADARRRHLAHYQAMADAVIASTTGPEQAARLDRLEAAYPNIRTALEFAARQAPVDGTCLNEGLSLAAAVSPLWRRRGPLAEGILHLEQLLALDDPRHRADPRIRGGAILEACALACFSGDYPAAAKVSRQGIDLFTALGDHHGLARAHRYLGEAVGAVGDFAAAQMHYEQALAEARQSGDLLAQASVSNMLGMLHRHQGHLSSARTVLRQSVRLFRSANEPDGEASALHSLGEAERDSGHLALARRLFITALRRHDALGNRRGTAFALEGLASVASLEGASRQALVYFGAAQMLRHQIGSQLTPVEQADFTQIFTRALDALTPQERQVALTQGRDQPLADTIAGALSTAPVRRTDTRPSRPLVM